MKFFTGTCLLGLALVSTQVMAADPALRLQTIRATSDANLCIGVSSKSTTYEGAALEVQTCSKREEGQLFPGGLQNWLYVADAEYNSKILYMPVNQVVGSGFCIDTRNTSAGTAATLTACDQSGKLFVYGVVTTNLGKETVLQAKTLANGATLTWENEVIGRQTQQWGRGTYPR
jgi:hypothetical protein